MSEMVVTVRDAIIEAMGRGGSLDDLSYAAIKAMRDPTSAMVFAAGDKARQVGNGDFVALWQAMIDDALSQSGD